MKIGQKIKLKREQIGLSVDELAEILGKNRATIYRYESSEIEKLPTTVLEPLAKALKTTPAYLMGCEDDKPADTLTVMPQNKIHMIPVFGSVAAGFGAYASSDIIEYMDYLTFIALKCAVLELFMSIIMTIKKMHIFSRGTP